MVFDSHVVVHLLSHESAFGVGFGLLADGQSIQLADVSEVIEHVCLVVAQIADGILSEVRIVERKNL